MATKTPAQLYDLLISVGFTPQSAATMVAIAGAESRYRSDVLGDVSLETSTWGPSYGYWQIRTLKNKTGSGDTRDVSWLSASDENQARAAYAISNGGRDFTPWSTYTSGAYREFLTAANSAGGLTSADNFTPDTGVGGWKAVVLESVFLLAGIGLAVYGVRRATLGSRHK